jgi:hypothetical protein
MSEIRLITVPGLAPSTTQLAQGDLAINSYDGKVYLKKIQGKNQNIIEVGRIAVSASYALTASYAENGGSSTTTIISGSTVTSSFTNSNTWVFNHNLGTRTPIITVFDFEYNQIIPQNIVLTDATTATITFPTLESGFAIGSTGGASGIAFSSSYSATASYVNPLNQAVLITGSLNITGSTFQTGNNTLIGITTLTGSILINGDIIPRSI